MSGDKESEVFQLLQPDLLTEEQLIQRIQSRCCRIENLGLMSKEGLVKLFRRVILPLPQRFYRANRRGKMLTSRRAETDSFNSRREEEGCSQERFRPRISASGDRLKPPPDPSKSHKIQIGSRRSLSGWNVDEVRSKAARGEQGEGEGAPSDRPPGRKVALKRFCSDEKSRAPTPPPSENKRQRTAIRWP